MKSLVVGRASVLVWAVAAAAASALVGSPESGGVRAQSAGRSGVEGARRLPASGVPAAGLPAADRETPVLRAEIDPDTGMPVMSEATGTGVLPRGLPRAAGERDAGAAAAPDPLSADPVTSDPGSTSLGSAARPDDLRPAPSSDPMLSGSPLRAVFDYVGSPRLVEELGACRITAAVRMRDERSLLLGSMYLRHDLVLGARDKDRIQFQYAIGDPYSVVYGRNGGAFYAERILPGGTVLDAPERLDEARDEVELLGLLARVPWCFADGAQFEMRTAYEQLVDGKQFRILPFERRAGLDEQGRVLTDRFELYCVGTVDGLQPMELRFVLHGSGGVERRMQLTHYRNVLGVPGMLMPSVRVVYDATGKSPALEMVFSEVVQYERPDPTRFEPGRVPRRTR